MRFNACIPLLITFCISCSEQPGGESISQPPTTNIPDMDHHSLSEDQGASDAKEDLDTSLDMNQVNDSGGSDIDMEPTDKDLDTVVTRPSLGRDEYCSNHDLHNHDLSADAYHPNDHDKHKEHMAALDLLQDEHADFVAKNCGDWDDPMTWGGTVPTVGSNVLIPSGIGVTYSGEGADLGYLKVSGYLEFDTTRSTLMRLNTLIGTPTSYVHIGTEENPVGASHSSRITIGDGDSIEKSEDPEELSHGVVLHGTVSVRGASKTPYVKLAQQPMSGETELKLLSQVSGWKEGDTILILGTHYDQGNSPGQGHILSEDEQRIITKISDTTITLDRPLQYNHDVPTSPHYELHGYAANLSRNIQFESENPDGVRGHFMVMHSDQASVRYASFIELGRTDKRRLFDESKPGRYPLHFHRAGTDASTQMVIADGNVVKGGPGWGIVHHDSRAAINRNIVVGVAGAGIVAEAGSEVGEWVGNLVTSTTGAAPESLTAKEVLETYGPGARGDAYSMMSRAIFQRGNIAANSPFGWVFEGRVGRLSGYVAGTMVPARNAYRFDPMPLHDWQNTTHQAIIRDGFTFPDPDIMQFVDFRDNEAIATNIGMRSTHRAASSRNNTDIINEIINFRAWRIGKTGIEFDHYSWDYTVRDSLLVGSGIGQGFDTSTKIENMNFVDTRIENFRIGYQYSYSNFKGVIVNLTIDQCQIDISSNENAIPLEVLTWDDITKVDRPSLVIDPDIDLTLHINRGLRNQNITGFVYDSAGRYPFATYRHMDKNGWVQASETIGYESFFGDGVGEGQQPVSNVVKTHGAMQKSDGTWITPVVFWVGDRITGHNHPVRVDFVLDGFEESFLKAHELSTFVMPNPEIEYLADQLAP